MSGKASRNKGAAAEREVAAIINAKIGETLTRTPLSGGMLWKGDIRGWKGYHVEVKRQETIKLQQWTDQCEADCPEGDIPLLIYRRSRQPWRVSMKLDDLLDLIKQSRE